MPIKCHNCGSPRSSTGGILLTEVSPTDSGRYCKAVLDITDDCPTILNGDQANPDGDAIIDACDDDLFSIAQVISAFICSPLFAWAWNCFLLREPLQPSLAIDTSTTAINQQALNRNGNTAPVNNELLYHMA